MRLSELSDSLSEITDERIIGGGPFYVSPRDRRTRKRIEFLRTKGYEIVSLGACRFRCESDPITDTLRTDGQPFHNTPETQKERYRLTKLGYRFRRLRKGVFFCCERPK